ncbi:hypothetical protein PYL56_07855 [Staphylococcus succinus]|uniref:hypothetical protein n=1 Tax=Staphylococcus succinus TaxID=61015 RepID=UPI0024813692|nr:hypothetical protein [Staphylococcus succinus]MDH9161280.1 hypothetical protein [Staphylococcus succinus]
MKLEEFQRLGQTVKTFTSKLHENPGKFVAIVTQMYWDIKAERDTLIDDLKVLREKNEKLERENKRQHSVTEQFKHDLQYTEWEIVPHLEQENAKLHEELKSKNRIISKRLVESEILSENAQLKQENKALRLQSNTYFYEWQNVKNLYTTLTDHIRLKASANPGEHRYIALVNFMNRLERGEYG